MDFALIFSVIAALIVGVELYLSHTRWRNLPPAQYLGPLDDNDIFWLDEDESEWPESKAQGWYHRDECDQLHGPFDSHVEAEIAFRSYVEML